MAKYKRILSIDGGGIRGIIPGQVLKHLEAKLEKLRPGTRLVDHFDLIAGTSTGGILTCIYLCPEPGGARPRFSAEDAVNLYLENGAKIFDLSVLRRARTLGGLRDEKYPAAPLEGLLRDYFGNLQLSQLLRPCLITAYDIKRRETKFFNQARAQSNPGRDFFVRDVARATSAAPTFFECANITSMSEVSYPLVDGGVFANNPALCAYAEVRKEGPTAKDMLILSLGTGQLNRPYDYAEAKDWGLANWAVPILDIMMAGVAETIDFQLRQIFDAVAAPKQYLRLQAHLDERNASLDGVEQENIRELAQIGTELAERHEAELDAFIQLLVEGQ